MGISNAIVVGGGIGGLAVAAALGQRGIAVTLLEQAASFSEVGAGLQVSPNGLAVLRAMGLEAAVRQKEAVRGEAVVLRDYLGGKVAHLDLMRLAAEQRYYFVHRADLVDVLAGAAKRANVSVEMPAAVAGVVPGDMPKVVMQNGSTRRAELVVAADGLHSVARPVLNGDDAAGFTGQVAWRALVKNRFNHPSQACVTMGPGRHLVSYPIKGGRLVNLVAVEERETWAAEGWNHADDPAHLRNAFEAFQGRAGEMIAAVEQTTLWGLHKHPVAKVWQQGGVALLGDAAHPTLPFLAQGANMALEDAWVLADEAKKGGADWAARYQQRRETRVRRVIKAAEGNAWRYHLHAGPVRTAAHVALRLGSRFAPGRMIGAYDWLYGVNVADL